MRAVIFAACAASACGFEGVASFEPTGDASTGDGPPGDRDGDGISDPADLCPDDADPKQRDHDGDARGDACDRCPFLSDPSDPDRDGDGVGDACDPHPQTPGDRRALWIGFYEGADSEDATLIADRTKWLPVGVGTWSIVPGGWAQVNATGVAVLRSSLSVERATAMSKIRLDDVSDSDAAAGVITGLVRNATDLLQFYQCVVFRIPKSINAKSAFGGSNIDDNFTTWPGPMANGETVELTASFGAMFECSFRAPETTLRARRGETAGLPELIVQDARVSFDYLFVVDSPEP